MEIDFESIKKLPAERRKKALQDVKAMITQEIDKFKEHLETTEKLLGIAETEASVLEEIAVPETREVEIKGLFKRKGLEEQIEKLSLEERKAVQEVAKKPIEDVYQRVKDIYTGTEVRDTYEDERTRDIYALGLAVKRDAVEKGEYRIGEKAEHLMTAAEKLTYKRL